MITNLTNFTTPAGLTLNGSALITGGVLRLTSEQRFQSSTAFSNDRMLIGSSSSFQTQFAFRLDGQMGTNGADGLTFIVQNSAAGSNAIGGFGGGLGYGDINRSLAVKFDTYQNVTDLSNNYVAVLTGGSVTEDRALVAAPFDLNDGSVINAWIDYDGITDRLAIYLSNQAIKPGTALLSYTVDLASVVGSQAFVGFGAGTGADFNNQDILNWQFSSTSASDPPDATPPSAVIGGLPIPAIGSPNYDFTVTYTDNIAVSVATLDNQDITVTGPNGFSQFATFVSVNNLTDGSGRQATYRFTAPNSAWSVADQGAYQFNLQANQVRDTAGNSASPAVLGVLNVSFIDRTPPMAMLSFPTALVNLNSSYDFVVTYMDNVGVKAATLGNQNIRVTGPRNFSQLATLVSIAASNDADVLNATYRITAPGAIWDDADNGTYTFALLAAQISDTSSNFAPEQILGTLPIVLADITPPTVTLSPLIAPVAASSTYDFTVTYVDRNDSDIASLDNNDILVTGPNNFSQLATLISVNNPTSGQFTAIYRLAAPGGTWNILDNGNYTFTLLSDQVQDISGNSALAQTLGSLTVNLVDVTPPSAAIGATPAPVSGATSYDFTVVYSDDATVNVATLDNQDIVVTGPGNFSQLAALVSVNTPGNGSPRTATYRIAAPGGSWDESDSGTYSIALRANQVADGSGNFAVAKTLGTVAVNLAPIAITGTAQADTLVAPDGQNYVFNGQGGNDKITGGAGNDTLVGGTGNDTLDGGGGTNTVSYAAATNGVTVNLVTGIANRIARLMPLGDSITLGISEGAAVTPEPLRSQVAGGYRTVLWNNFQRDGVTVDFVGTKSNGPASLGDKDNEGNGGKTIGFISENVLSYLSSTKPDAVLLMIGTNDTFATAVNGSLVLTTASKMASDLSALIDKIMAFSPDLKLFVSSIPPILPNADERLSAADQARQKQLAVDYNNLLPGLIAQKQAAGAAIEFVDMRSSLTDADIVQQGSSGVHPTQPGYTKIGNLWYAALNAKLGVAQGTYKVDQDTLSNIQNITGSGFNDTLVGNGQSNVMTGGLGSDRLTGGGGADVFAYKAVNEGGDTITDFGADDKFRIAATGFGGGLTVGVNLSLTAATTGMLVNGAVATSGVGTFIYSNGVLQFDADGTGSGQAVTIATLLNGPATLTVNQFEITV